MKINGKMKHLGLFVEEKSAAEAYDLAALQNNPQFALTNSMLHREKEEREAKE